MIDGGPVFVDVREADEFAAVHAKSALNLPLSRLVTGARPDLPKDKKLVLYCNSGNRSAAAMNMLSAAGYKDLENGISKEEVEKRYIYEK